MESPDHGYHNPAIDRRAIEWTSINRPGVVSSVLMESSPRSPGAVQSGFPSKSATKTTLPPFKPLAANASRPLQPLLPRPQPHSRSRTDLRLCLVCGRLGCALQSHKLFAEQTLMYRVPSKQPSTPTKSKTSVRQSQITSSRPVEPITQYPVAMDAEYHRLLALWSGEWGNVRRGPERHLFPTRWIDVVLPTALGHAPLFQALLATSASMWAMAHARLSESTTRHLQLADRILQQSCTTPETARDDPCILAALLLTVVYQAQGNVHETDLRFHNIVRLVGEKGGPWYLKISGVVADVLLYVDCLQAVLLDCEPVWSIPLPPLAMGVHERFGSAFRELNNTNTLHPELLSAADSVSRATDIFDQPPHAGSLKSRGSYSFGYLSTVTEYQLAHCNAIFHGSNTWDECICLALLLFNHVILRNDGTITAPMRKLEHQLWQTIDDTILRVGFGDVPPCLLLWVFMTGLSPCILADCQYRYSAVRRMRAARIPAAINGWDNFQSRVLDDFVWVRMAQEEAFRNIWLEVEGYKTS